ncbi:MAG: type II secretion system protein [Planctomycetaceae bacterium]|nr:type II secretion system protein [Planctomycetaceae bacterium]
MIRKHNQPTNDRAAFTLVELLVVITIIGMLAGMSLGAVYAARQSARKAKTQATIAKLDVIIQAKYAEFFTRRLPMRNRRMPPDAMAELKFRVLHEIMRMEMPDRVRDIVFPVASSSSIYPSTTAALDFTTDMSAADGDLGEVHPVASFASADRSQRSWVDTNGTPYAMMPDEKNQPIAGIARTSLAKRYWRQLYSNRDKFDPKFDSAECLYMIIQADPEAREQFRDDEIGDADGDGFMEFHDAWDRPIMFIRWAPGFVTESDLMTGDPENDSDPMNPRRLGDLIEENSKWHRPATAATYRLVPLVYSGGPDKIYGLNQKSNWNVQFAPGESLAKVWIDGLDIGAPCSPTDPDPDVAAEAGHHTDNITNHSLGMN